MATVQQPEACAKTKLIKSAMMRDKNQLRILM